MSHRRCGSSPGPRQRLLGTRAVNQVETHPFFQRTPDQDVMRELGQVVLHWLTQRGVVVIPKSVKPERMAQIATLDTGASLFIDHSDPAMVRWLGEHRIQ